MRRRTLAAILLALPCFARADLVPVQWDAQGRFVAALPLSAGGLAEACTALAKGERVRWRFRTARPLKFNIHYHEGQQVHFPVQAETASGEGTLDVALGQDFCWMWQGSDRPERVELTLERLP